MQENAMELTEAGHETLTSYVAPGCSPLNAYLHAQQWQLLGLSPSPPFEAARHHLRCALPIGTCSL